jgi:molybdopterin/thiamine biosynthesis adenylyltransferase
MGGSQFINLARLGVERFHVADPDIFERTNINRQRGALESTIRVRKDEALIAAALDINPAISVTTFPEGVQAHNVDTFLDGLDWVIDTVDVYALDCKLLLHEGARERDLPVISSATLGHGGVVMVFDSSTPSFAELSGIGSGTDRAEGLARFVEMLMPEVPEYMRAQAERAMAGEGHIPFVVTGVEFAAGIVVVELLNHTLGMGTAPKAPKGIYCDPVALRLEEFTSPAWSPT